MLKRPEIGVSLGVSGVWLLSCCAGLAHAQAQEPLSASPGYAIEEVVVTARKRTENLQETPIAITAFDNKMLETIGATDFKVASEYTPNFVLVNTTSSNHNVAASIRGIASAEPSFAQDPKIGFYLDGVYLAKNSGALFDLVDLERIEVLRGPQGTLYGRNTTGGAISLISAKPSGEFGLKQRLTLGNRGRFVSTTNIDTQETSGFSAKLSYMHKELDGLTRNRNENTDVDYLGSQDTDALRAALRWEPNDSVTVDYSYDRQRSNSVAKAPQISYVNPAYAQVPVVTSFSPFTIVQTNPFAQLIAAGGVAPDGPLDSVSLDAIQPEKVDVEGHALVVAWALEGATIKSTTALRNYDSRTASGTRGGSDFDGGDWDIPFFHIGTPASNGIRKEHEQFSQEFQLSGDALSDRLQYTLGAFYFEEDAEEASNRWDALIFLPGGLIPGVDSAALYAQEAFLGLPPGGLGEIYSIHNESWGLYSHLTYTPDMLEDRLSVSVGVRYTEDTREATILDASPNWNEKQDYSNVSPGLTVSYQLSDEMNLYAKVVRGYNAGSFPVRAGSRDAFAESVEEETIVDYELGLKSQWMDDRVRLNLAAFYYDFDDLQVSDFRGGSTILVNAGKAEVQGFEVEFVALPTEHLRVTADFGYTDFVYKEFFEGGVDRADEAKAPLVPKKSGTVAAEYTFDPFAFGVLQARIDATHRDGYKFNPFNYVHDSAGATTLYNARLTLGEIPISVGELRLALWGRNLGDKEYRDFGVDFGPLGFAVNTWAEQRSYGLDVIYEY